MTRTASPHTVARDALTDRGNGTNRKRNRSAKFAKVYKKCTRHTPPERQRPGQPRCADSLKSKSPEALSLGSEKASRVCQT